MKYTDYYAVMGLGRDASADDIKRAYRKLARKYHPDVSKEPDAEARFKKLGEAYAVLKDPEKRLAYDQLGENWQAGEDFQPPPDWSEGFEFGGGASSAGVNPDDLFASLFGQGFQRAQRDQGSAGFQMRGEDQHARIHINIEDAYRGATRSITLTTPDLDSNKKPVHRERQLDVKIPKGIRAGQRIRLAGQGSTGVGGAPAGDLYLEVFYHDHPIYRAEDRDVYFDLPIAPWEAALGATVRAPTPTGPVSLNIPAGTRNGRKLRLKERGIPGSEPGDLYAIARISTPPADTDEAREFYQTMAEKLAFNPRSALGV